MKEVFSWNQIGYNIDGVLYTKDAVHERKPGGVLFEEDLDDDEMFFKQYNNVPIGLAVHKTRVFITVPRRRYGIVSTLNYVDLKSGDSSSPLLKPYPSSDKISSFVSVYRPRVDACDRLWMVDTGLLEVPGNFVQKKQPSIIIYDLKTDQEILTYELNDDVIVNGTTSGFTSITVDVTPTTCSDAFAYITDLAQNGLVVFSLREKTSWRFNHKSFKYDDGASYFRVKEHEIAWKDGLFSVALSDPDNSGKRKAFYHPFIATEELSISNEVLKNRNGDFEKNYKVEGVRGVWSQSGSHDYHSGTRTLLFGNVAQDGILCLNIDKPITSKTTALIAQDHKKLVYISDLKVVGDDVWVLVNQIPVFIYSKFNTTVTNFYVHRGKVADLIRGTVCEK